MSSATLPFYYPEGEWTTAVAAGPVVDPATVNIVLYDKTILLPVDERPSTRPWTDREVPSSLPRLSFGRDAVELLGLLGTKEGRLSLFRSFALIRNASYARLSCATRAGDHRGWDLITTAVPNTFWATYAYKDESAGITSMDIPVRGPLHQIGLLVLPTSWRSLPPGVLASPEVWKSFYRLGHESLQYGYTIPPKEEYEAYFGVTL